VVGRLWLLVAGQALTTASDRFDDAGLAVSVCSLLEHPAVNGE